MATSTHSQSAPSFADRLAARAADVSVVALVLSLLAVVPWLIGFIIGVMILVARWSYAAVLLGIETVTKRLDDDAG